MPKPRIYDHLAETWKAEYLSGLSVHKIGKRHGVRGQSVHAYLVHTGMKPTGSVQHRKTRLIQYEGHQRLLKLAGWLYSDGGPRLSRKLKTLTDNIGYIACAGEIASGA